MTTSRIRRPRSRRGATRTRVVALTALLVLALSGCLRMPTEGPVVSAEPQAAGDSETGAFYEPRSPEEGATPDEIVFGFLEAMKATPVRTSIAAEYLSKGAQRAWSPEKGTLTYADLDQPEGQVEVSVQLIGGQAYDLRGAWSRRLGEREARVRFPMILEGEEWRIDSAPDALIVPERWFGDWFERASLHFFDPTQSTLVPEPVFVPGGDQMATALVRGLLAGAPDPAVSRGAFPPGARLAMSSVPIDERGVAEVVLDGVSGTVDDVVTQEMVAQLVWTLRQEPRVRAIRLTIEGSPVTLPGGEREISVDVGQGFSPTGASSSRDLFALQDGRLVRGDFGSFSPTTGPFGVAPSGLRSVGVTPEGDVAVGITRGGARALLAPVSQGEPVVEVLAGAQNLLPPRFDLAGRLWLVDRTTAGARVLVRDGEGPAVPVAVPGISGERVSAFLVSRDSSRLVAVLRGPRRDRLVVIRVKHADTGLPGFSRAEEIDLGPDVDKRIADIGWRSPVSVGVLTNIAPDLAQVRVLSVDGAPGEIDTAGGIRIRGRGTELVSSPVSGDSVFVVTDGRVNDVVRSARQLPQVGESITWFDFVG